MSEIRDATPCWAKLQWADGEISRLRGEVARLAATPHQASDRARYSPRPELDGVAARGIGREGVVTVWDHDGCYLGCMGVETWERLLREAARAE